MGAPKNLLTVAVSEDDVQCIAGALAELWIAVNELKVVEQDVERADRLNQATHLTEEWGKAFRLRADLARLEAKIGGVS